jgi:5'-nucleotidase
MRFLVTNDDGVTAPGIAVLARAVAAAGHDVVVAGPLEDRSGSGAAIGPVHLGEGISYQTFAVDGLDQPAYGLDGPPALAVMAARLGAFGPPVDIVVSGINPGPNTGRSVLHSGTVGAALTGANFGVSGLAVSIGTGDEIHWDTAAELAVAAIAWLLEAPVKTVLNLNVPNLPRDQVRGVRSARLAPFGTVRTAIAGHRDGRLELELRATEEELSPDTDTALVTAGYAAVTSIVGIRASAEPDSAVHLDEHLRAGGGAPGGGTSGVR